MKVLTKLEKFGVMAALVIGSSFFYMKYMYDPQTISLETTLKKRNKIVAELNRVAEVPSLFRLEKTIEQNKEILEELREESGTITVKTGNPDEITELLSKINQIIELNQLDVNTIVPKDEIIGPYLRWAPFEMDLSGTFGGYVAFMKDIKDLDDAVEIRDLVLENSEEQKESVVNIQFTLKI
jgi:Tfp pilus assembly protein PilO